MICNAPGTVASQLVLQERSAQTVQSGGIIEVVHDIDQVGGAHAELQAFDSLLKLVVSAWGIVVQRRLAVPGRPPAVSFAQTTRISHSWTSP